MPNESAPPLADRPRVRFTLSGMMVFTLGAAIGAAVWRTPRASWDDGVMAAVAVWMMLGLANQARDLWRCLGGPGQLSRAERCGWQYSIAWRVLVIAGTGANLVFRLIAPEDYSAKWYWGLLELDLVGDRPYRLLATVLIIVALASVPAAHVRRQRKQWFVVPVLGALAFAVWAMLVAYDAGWIPSLVHCVTWGIRMASHAHAFDVSFVRWRSEFVHWSLWAAPLALLNLAIVRQVARSWAPSSWSWRVWMVAALGGLAAVWWYVAWTAVVALPRFDPDAHEAMFTYSALYFVLAGALIGIVVTVACYRWTTSDNSSNASTSNASAGCRWRLRPAAYYHELAGLAAMVLLASVYRHGDSWYFNVTHFGNISSWFELLGVGLQPEHIELLALEILAAQILFNRWRYWPGPQGSDPAPIAPIRFATCWLLTLLALLGLAAALAGFGVTLWMRPL